MTVNTTTRAIAALAAVFFLGAIGGSLLMQRAEAINVPVPCSQLPGLTGDTTASAGSCVTTDRLHLISTLTANNTSPSLAWTGLATYNTYQQVCSHIFPASAATLYIQTGEGATPTWNTANYRWVNQALLDSSSTAANAVSVSDSGMTPMGGGSGTTAASASSWIAIIHNVTSTTSYKEIDTMGGGSTAGTVHTFSAVGQGTYYNTTNAVTALRVQASTGNISGGVCSLFALVQ